MPSQDVYTERTYRRRVGARDLVSFRVVVKETDLWISAGALLEKEVRDLVFLYRHQLEAYIQQHNDFMTTLQPYPEDPFAPPIVREMISASRSAGVGPMAAVAGAIAQFVGLDLMEKTGQVIIENGGDVFMKLNRSATVAVFAGESPLSDKIGIKVAADRMPLGVCSSSGKIGHSYSLGVADVVCIVSPSAIVADSAATALCNEIKGKRDLKKISQLAGKLKGIHGGLAIVGERMATWGDIELVGL